MPRIKDLYHCHLAAALHGGKCLSTKYVNCKTKYLWECSEGHRWEVCVDSIFNGRTWCPYCAGRGPITVSDCHQLAEQMGGKFLSEEYVNNSAHYLWGCSEGHQWPARYNNIKTGYWCPECAGTKKKTVEDARALAKVMGGLFLSEHYTSNRGKYTWQCSEGHKWDALYTNVQKGHWCLKCVKYTKGQVLLVKFCKTIDANLTENAQPLAKPNHRLQLDVYYKDSNKAIELDGDYWHNKPGRPERDARKNKACADAGIELLRLDYDKHWAPYKRHLGQQLIRDFLK